MGAFQKTHNQDKGFIMAHNIIALTDKKIQNSKPKEKKYKLSDGGGLFAKIRPREKRGVKKVGC